MNPNHIFRCFTGCWNLERKVVSSRGTVLAHCEGEASFEPYEKKENHLIYFESGKMILTGQAPMNFHKEYHFTLLNNNINIFFDSNLQRVYHSIDFTSRTPTGNHFCNQDTYEVTYKLDLPTKYQTECKVSGPQKDYIIYSIYKKTRSANFTFKKPSSPTLLVIEKV